MEVRMEPSIEIEPSKFVIVVGPRFTANVLSELTTSRSPGCDHKAPVFAYKDIVDEGITLLLQTETFQNDGEKTKYETLYRNAYELDPAFALRKVAVNLKKAERYQEWLNRLFGWRVEHSLRASPSLQHLLDLQRNGALLVYTHYDDLLDQAAELQPVLLKDAERWSAGECPGFLHVHGVLSEPGTVKLDCDFYETISTHPSHQATAGVLKAVFQKRHAVVVGFDACVEDPLQSQFMETFLDEKDTRHAFVLDQATPPSGLPLVLSSASFSVPLASAVAVVGESSQSLWRQMEFPNDNSETNQSLGLLVAGKRGASEISKMMFKAPGVDFALVSSVTHGTHVIHTVCIRVSSLQLKELWQWVFVDENTSLLSKGLLAVVMETGTFVWLRGKPMPAGSANSTFAATLSSSGDTHKTPSSDKEVAMETNHSETSNSVKAILSQKPGHGCCSGGGGTRIHRRSLSPLTTQDLPAVPKGKKIPRYTVHKFKVKSGGTNGVSSLLRQKKEFKDDSGILGVPRSVLNRRPSLPPMKPTEVPSTEQSSVLSRLAENLQNGTSSDAATSPPSYTAIKQALLADSYKRRQSVQIDPKTLKNLLQSKLASSEESALRRDLLTQRRNSDPGILNYWKQRDFDRRKELFVDENESWSRNYGRVIDKKIVTWQKKRHERRQREFLRKQAELSPNGQNSALKFQILNPLTSAQGIVTPYAAEVKTIPAAAAPSLVQPTPYLNPFLYPQQSLFTPTTTSDSNTASMVYSPYVSPYNFVSPYSMQLANPQTTTYLIQASPAAPEQKVFYFVPSSTSRTVSTTPTGYTLAPSTTTMPQLSSLIAPTTAHPHTHANTQHEVVHMQEIRTESNNLSSKNRKRKHTLPEKLSTLLQHQADEDPELPTSPKKHKMIHTARATHSPPHSQTASVLERHLLQPSPEHNGYHSDPEDREAEEIVGGAPYSPVGQRKDPPVVPAPRSQLQLWQFLLELLLISANSHLIQWTDNDLEFQINRPSEVALLWGKCTNNPGMNYEKLARGLRYYYSRGIMSKVPGRRLTFQYAGNVRSYVQLRRSQTVGSTEEVVLVE